MANYINLNELSITTQALLKKINEQADLKVDKDEVTAATNTGDIIASVGDVDIYNGVDAIPSKVSELTNDSGFITDAGVTSFNGLTGAVTRDYVLHNAFPPVGYISSRQVYIPKKVQENYYFLLVAYNAGTTQINLSGYAKYLDGTDSSLRYQGVIVDGVGLSSINLSNKLYLARFSDGTLDLHPIPQLSTVSSAIANAIPTSVSQLTNDSGYQTESQVNTLIGTAIGNINQFNVSIVQTLPTQDIDGHTIYFVPNSSSGNNVYEEWMYINSQWEHIGNTSIDLSNYLQKSDVSATASYSAGTTIGSITVDGTTTTLRAPSEADNIYSLNLSSYTRQQLSQGIVDSADASVISEIDSNYEEGVTKVKFSFTDDISTPDIVATSAGPKFSITLDGNTFNNVMKFTFAGVYLESASEMLSPPSFVASIYIVPNVNMIMLVGLDLAENFDRIDSGLASLETSLGDLATVATTGEYSDLQNAPDLSGFVDSSSLATVATTGDYEDLTNTPTSLSDFTNDADYLTSSDVSEVAISGDYNDLINAPNVLQSGDYVKTISIRDIGIPFDNWDQFDSASFKYSAGLSTFPQTTIDEIDNFLTDSTTLAVVTRIKNSNEDVIQSSVILNYVNTYTDTDLNLGKTRMFVGVVTDKIGSTQMTPRNPHILSLGIGDNGALCSLWTVAEIRDIPQQVTPPVYTMSMTGSTINLLADGVVSSSITLPIYDGTVV